MTGLCRAGPAIETQPRQIERELDGNESLDTCLCKLLKIIIDIFGGLCCKSCVHCLFTVKALAGDISRVQI